MNAIPNKVGDACFACKLSVENLDIEFPPDMAEELNAG